MMMRKLYCTKIFPNLVYHSYTIICGIRIVQVLIFAVFVNFPLFTKSMTSSGVIVSLFLCNRYPMLKTINNLVKFCLTLNNGITQIFQQKYKIKISLEVLFIIIMHEQNSQTLVPSTSFSHPKLQQFVSLHHRILLIFLDKTNKMFMWPSNLP